MADIMEPVLAAAWRDIVDWYSQHEPERIDSIAGPAPEAAIAALESQVGVKLPPSYADSLRLHNGRIAIHKYDFLSAENAARTWSEWKAQRDAGQFANAEVIYAEDGRIQPQWWIPNWIPVARESGGNMLLIDTAPGPNGTLYQLIALDMIEGPSPSRRWKDFPTWVQSFADDLKAGRYSVVDGDMVRS